MVNSSNIHTYRPLHVDHGEIFNNTKRLKPKKKVNSKCTKHTAHGQHKQYKLNLSSVLPYNDQWQNKNI